MQLQLRDFAEQRSHTTFPQRAVLGATARWGGYVYRARVAYNPSDHLHPWWLVVLGLLRRPDSPGRSQIPGALLSQHGRARRHGADELFGSG